MRVTDKQDSPCGVTTIARLAGCEPMMETQVQVKSTTPAIHHPLAFAPRGGGHGEAFEGLTSTCQEDVIVLGKTRVPIAMRPALQRSLDRGPLAPFPYQTIVSHEATAAAKPAGCGAVPRRARAPPHMQAPHVPTRSESPLVVRQPGGHECPRAERYMSCTLHRFAAATIYPRLTIVGNGPVLSAAETPDTAADPYPNRERGSRNRS